MFRTIITYPNLSFKEAASKFKWIASFHQLDKKSPLIACNGKHRVEIMNEGPKEYTVLFERWVEVQESSVDKIRNRAGLKNQLTKQLN